MKTATAVAQVVDVTCPHCHEGMTDPRTGSYMITSDSFRVGEGLDSMGDVLTCQTCGKRSRLPKTARVFA